MVRMNRIVQVLLLGGLVVLQGCMFTMLRNELREMKHTRVLTGRVLDQVQPETNVVLILYRQTPDGLKIVNGTLLDSAVGQFVVKVPIGTFYLFAFEDLDNDLAWDGKEPNGYYGMPDAIVVTDSSPATLSGFDIRLNASAPPPGIFPETISLPAEALGSSIVKTGQIVDLDDPILSQDYGNKGYWGPLTFVREVGFCLFSGSRTTRAKYRSSSSMARGGPRTDGRTSSTGWTRIVSSPGSTTTHPGCRSTRMPRRLTGWSPNSTGNRVPEAPRGRAQHGGTRRP